MVEATYNYGKKRHQKKRWRWSILAFILILLLLAALLGYDVYRGRSKQQSGAPKISQLVVEETPKIQIDEPTFTLKLPADWKEIRRIDAEYESGITWQATKPKEDNRFMTLYIDKIPRSKPFNKLLPLEAIGSELRHGSVSDNCATYTEGGSLDANSALKAKPTSAKWEEVTFICDLPKVFDNVVGTSSLEGVNIVNVTGPAAGKHSYFFLYTDHNAHPNYEILTEIVESFKAK